MENHLSRFILLILVASAMIVATASVAAITTYSDPTHNSAETQDICLTAGPDSTLNPTAYPAATVMVAPTNDSATIALSLFPSAASTPQPATYYTNLLQVTNTGTSNHTINSVEISGITGASNLGCITIYYYAAQTDSPQSSTAVASAAINSTSTDTVKLLNAYTMEPSVTNYIEIVGYANPTAATGVNGKLHFGNTINHTEKKLGSNESTQRPLAFF